MNDNIRSIARVAKIDHAESIAAGLEHLADEIRAGQFRFTAERVAVVVSGRTFAAADDFAMAYFGADASTAEVVGMLELAKLQAAGSDA